MASLAIAPDIFSLNKYISTVLAIPSTITLHFRALLQLLLPSSWIIHRQHLHFLVSQNLNSLFLSPQFFVLFCLDIYSSVFFILVWFMKPVIRSPQQKNGSWCEEFQTVLICVMCEERMDVQRGTWKRCQDLRF